MLISDNPIISPEKQSLINAILFYKEELLKIDRGEKATKHLNERQRRSLVKQGILTRNYGQGGCRLELTNQTKQIIQNTVTNNIS
jgi:hypothetical protein